MANNLVVKIELVNVNSDGTINIIDIPSWTDYPFNFQYKLYLSYKENLKNIFQLLFSIPPENYELSSKFLKFIENRKALFEEISKEYLPIINGITYLKMSTAVKNRIINEIDLELNRLYPYEV